MKTAFLRFWCNISIKSQASGCSQSWMSCRRCISHTVVSRQELEKKEQTATDLTGDDLDESLKHDDYFNVRELVTLTDLFNQGAHFGHNIGCRNDYMKPYLFGNRSGMDIIDLEQTVPLFQDALNFTAHIAYRNGIILFVSRNKGMLPFIEKTAEVCGEYAHCRYWQPGLFTNVRARTGYSIRLPDLVIILNTMSGSLETHRAVVECAKLLIPTVGIVDSNCDPRLITYPIPANDDSFKTISYYLNLFETTIMRAKQMKSNKIKAKEKMIEEIMLQENMEDSNIESEEEEEEEHSETESDEE